MKCKSCEEVVPSKFAHAIKQNECPLCGGEIMPVQLQNILSSLKTLMEEAKDKYMDEVKDWLASNYSLGTVNKNNIGGVEGNPVEAQNVKMTGPELYNKFAALARVPGAGKPRASLSSVVAEIKGRSEPMNM